MARSLRPTLFASRRLLLFAGGSVLAAPSIARAQAQNAQAKAQLIQAEENFKRVEGLTASKVATQKALEDAIAQRDSARAAEKPAMPMGRMAASEEPPIHMGRSG